MIDVWGRWRIWRSAEVNNNIEMICLAFLLLFFFLYHQCMLGHVFIKRFETSRLKPYSVDECSVRRVPYTPSVS